MRKSILSLAATAVVGVGIMGATTAPADAAYCYYRLKQDGVGILTGKFSIQGYAVGIKHKNACKRAQNECNRRFDRARKKGNLPRGGPRDFRCVRSGNG